MNTIQSNIEQKAKAAVVICFVFIRPVEYVVCAIQVAVKVKRPSILRGDRVVIIRLIIPSVSIKAWCKQTSVESNDAQLHSQHIRKD